MSQDLEDKRRHLKALEEFIKSPAHEGYLAAVEREIEDTKDAILAVTPDSLRDFVEELQLRGELRCLESRLTMFGEARVALSDRIDEMVEAEITDATNTKR
jgi:hypothetical protein